MRPIKFKGKHLVSGKWIEGSYVRSYDDYEDGKIDHVIIDFDTDVYRIDPETLCQFTGLTDRNGKEIWEGDIVVFSYPHIDARIKGIVKWDAEWSCFALFKPDFKYAFESDWSRIMDRNVIGNSFDNPELMEVVK